MQKVIAKIDQKLGDSIKEEYNMLKEIKRLKSIRGSGTELISIYVPAGFQISEELNKLREERSTSSNIKSKTTRTNVLAAIDKISQYLKLYKETPKNGIAIFCGNISDNPGKTDIELFSMEPPTPLKVNIYRCDSTFLLEPIEEMVEAKDSFLLVVLDGREATIGMLKGHYIKVLKRLNSTAHAKVRKGGQSARRYERAIEESIEDYYKRIASSINDIFEANQFKIKGLIVGGPGPAKDGFIKQGSLNYQIKILGIYDVGYTDEYGLNELVEKAQDLLKEQEASQERQVLEKFITEISRNGLAVYGYVHTLYALRKKQVKVLIVNEDIDLYSEIVRSSAGKEALVIFKNENGAKSFVDIDELNEEADTQFKETINKAKEMANNRSAALADRISMMTSIELGREVIDVKDAVEELLDIADKNGTQTIFVSSESSYGKEFLIGFGGIGALLIYK
ncbi:MAG: peptide chain release factor aRF-1 [Candidatus Micrarchaeaceae archaeon]